MNWNALKPELCVALNEATLLGFEIDGNRRLGAATFQVLTLPVEGKPVDDTRVQFLFSAVGRVAATYRLGRWDDPSAVVVPFQLPQLLDIVQGFGGLPIYGWEFFDVHEEELARWENRISLDWKSGSDGTSHSIRVFQESVLGPDKYLSLVVWFDTMEIRKRDGKAIDVEAFASGGRRWWDALYASDTRTAAHGIFPLKPNGGNE